MLTKNLKEFLEKNIELIEENKFDELYKKAENDLYFSQDIGMLTRTLQAANIDPIEYLSEISYCYLYGDSKITQFVIPDKIEFVNSEAFANCSQLNDVIFGKDVSVIYYGAFEGCTELTNVTLNDGLLEIGQYAFRNTNIEKLLLPSTLRSIDVQAFPELITLEVFPGTYAHEWAVTNGYEVEIVY